MGRTRITLRAVRLRVEGAESCLTAGPAPRLSWQAEPWEAELRNAEPSNAEPWQAEPRQEEPADAPGAEGAPIAESLPPSAWPPVAAEPEVCGADGTMLWAPGPLPLPRHATTRVTVPAETALPTNTACRWRVRLQTGDGPWGLWSEWNAFGTGLGDDDWTGQWLARRPGGRVPLRIADGALRWHATPFAPVPVELGSEFTIDAELRAVFGSAGLAFHTAGQGTGFLLEIDRTSHVVLRPLPHWCQPAEPSQWSTTPLAQADAGTKTAEADASANTTHDADATTARAHAGSSTAPADADAETGPAHTSAARPGDGHFRHVHARAYDGTLTVVVDGRRLFEAELPRQSGNLLALHATPRAEGALRSLTVHDGNGREMFSFNAADGLAGWATTTAFRQPDEWTLLRQETALLRPVRRAVLYAAARHQAWVSINGREVLALSSFGYPGEDYYDAADVTEAIRTAGPRVAVAILSHWYGPGQGRAAGHPGVLAELRLDYEDGTHEVVATGPGWRAAEAPYGQAGYRNDEGDPIEHAISGPPEGWDRPGFDDSGWEPARVVGSHPCTAFPALHPRRAHVTEHREAPIRWLEADDGTAVADFGNVRARRPHVTLSDSASRAGAPIRLRAGYTLRPDGRVDDAITPSQNTDMSFLAGPATDTFEARVHLGFRYLEFDGARAARLDAAVVHAAHPAEAAVECSDPDLTRVLQLLQDSALHGVQERFVDTPTREKGQFLADAANISYATMAAFGEREFTRQALREFAWSGRRYWHERLELGRVNAVYPNGDGKRDIPDFSLMLPEWAEAYWMHTGDDAFVAELLPRLEETCGYALRSVPETGSFAGLVTRLEGGSGPYLHGIVDWPAPNRFGYDMETAARTTVNAQAFATLSSTARLSRALGQDRRAALLDERAATLADAMHRRLRVDGILVDGLRPDGAPSPHASQHASAFPLAVGATDPGHRAADALRAASLGLRMGPMTWHRLLAGLIGQGLVDQALGLILDDPGRGPLAWLARDATFAWESWELAEGSDHSQSHAWAAAAWPVLVDGILGLRRAAPGRFELRPPECRLEWARASLPLEQGTLKIAWRRCAEGIELDYELPPGVEAIVGPAGTDDGD